MCSKPSSLQMMPKFDWLAAEVQLNFSPFTFSFRPHTKVEYQQRLRPNTLLAFLLTKILEKLKLFFHSNILFSSVALYSDSYFPFVYLCFPQ